MNEELTQRGYYVQGKLKGDKFGQFESFNLGSTTLGVLVRAGLNATLPSNVAYPFAEYRPPKRVGQTKPDRLICRRVEGELYPVAVVEHKSEAELGDEKSRRKACEQALFYAIALNCKVGILSDGNEHWYIQVGDAQRAGSVRVPGTPRPLTPAILAEQVSGDEPTKDPTALAESVWQHIWHATKAEPKECLLTFVEIFVLKFLSDNLPARALPLAYRFQELLSDSSEFQKRNGALQIEYYVKEIRPRIKQLFPDNVVSKEEGLAELFGLKTIVSKTSVINGFAFLRTSQANLEAFNDTFVSILRDFERFGPLTRIDPEFKLRLYETFLKRSARQQRLGQFFTPRNIVKPMIRMAQLDNLDDGAVVLDPAAGVGGFVLEPALLTDGLSANDTFKGGTHQRRIRTIGVDVDADLHILSKANAILHWSEAVRDPGVTLDALNAGMANTMVLMNENEMLGSLLNPPRNSVERILTNPPYVTQGSAVYKDAAKRVEGSRNETDLGAYYSSGGLGVESLFLRYISGALRPGGRAFVIVPQGLLNRSEPRPKKALLDECNLIASISLPRKAFFNTPQPTYILVLEKRHTEHDPRPDVFCGVALSIGETLDHRRLPIPEENNLNLIAEAYVQRETNGHMVDVYPFIKVLPAGLFSAEDRWDVIRHWSDEELVALGYRPPAVSRKEFLQDTKEEIANLLDDLTEVVCTLEGLEPEHTIEVSLGDSGYFSVRSGTRFTLKDLREHPGDMAVYSCFTKAAAEKGRVDEEWAVAEKGAEILEPPCVTVNATGASGVGIVFVRENRCMITDDVVAVGIAKGRNDIDPHYLAVALRAAVASGDFQYEAKLYVGRVKELVVRIPCTVDGALDLNMQRKIGESAHRSDMLKERLEELGARTRSARISD